MNTEDLQRNCIAFAEWILNSLYTQGEDSKGKYWFHWNNYDETFTTEQLFQIYLNEKNI